MPIGLRSQIGSDHLGDWYRQMYNTLHRKKTLRDGDRLGKAEMSVLKLCLTFFKKIRASQLHLYTFSHR